MRQNIIFAITSIISLCVGFAIARTYIIDSSYLTLDMLQDRKGSIIIEKCVGVVTDSEKNGDILNIDSEFDYISYKNVRKAKEGDIITTYFVYNPFNNVEDDILFRFDFIQ